MIGCMGLTHRQRDCLLVIQDLMLTSGGASPSYAEIARELETGKGNVCMLIQALETRGWITRGPRAGRSVTVLRWLKPLEDVEFVGTFEAPELVDRLKAEGVAA